MISQRSPDDGAVVLSSPPRGTGPALGVVVLSLGLQAIVTQSLVLREAMTLLSGSELAWGIVLFAWLLGIAIGAVFGGRVAPRIRRLDYVLVGLALLLGAGGCAELWLFRGARAWLNIGPGELVPLPKLGAACLLFVTPVSALVGASFPIACDLAGRCGAAPDSTLSRIYALESAGSLLGGLAFSFWAVDHWPAIQTALLSGALTLMAGALLLATARTRRASAFLLAVIAGGAAAIAVLHGHALDSSLVQRRWQNVAPGYELVAHADSRYQNLAIGKREDQFALFCEGQIAGDFPDPYTYVPLAHFWMCQHPSPRRILLIGGSTEGLLAEILRYPVQSVDCIEIDPRQMELVQARLSETDRRALWDPRVRVRYVDIRYFLKTHPLEFDLVITRLPEPISAMRARLYTTEFFSELRNTMADEAVLCMTAVAAPTSLSTDSAIYLRSIRDALAGAFPEIRVGWGDPAQIIAATAPHLLAQDPVELAGRYAASAVHSESFDPLWFTGNDWLDPLKVRQRQQELDAAPSEPSTDLRPVIYMQRLALRERMLGPSSALIIDRLRAIPLWSVIFVLAAVSLAPLAACCLRHGRARGPARGALLTSIGTTGFATMALSILWLFVFQSLYGHVYQRIAWIIALFMGGLVIGCLLASTRTSPSPPAAARTLARTDVLTALLALAVPLLVPLLSRMQTGPGTMLLVEYVVSIMVALTGVLCGRAFRLGGILSSTHDAAPARSAAAIVGADHVGACLGALLTGILLVPVFGMTATALVLTGMKLSSAAVLRVAWKSPPVA